MSGTMSQAFETAKNPKGRAPSATVAASEPHTEDAVKAAQEAIRKRRETTAHQQASQTEAVDHKTKIEQVATFREEEETVAYDLAQAEKQRGRHPKGSLQAKEIADTIDQLTAMRAVIVAGLKAIEASNHTAYTEGTRRYNFRQEALEMADANRRLIGSATAVDIRGRFAGAVEAGFEIILSPEKKAEYEENSWQTVSFDKQSYGSAWPNDPSVSDVAMSLKELVEDLQNRKDNDDQVIITELHRGGFYISARRDPDATRPGESLDSELDLLRQELGLVRKASEFLAGNSGRYIARVGRGFMVMEHRDGKFFAVKTSDTRAGRALFTVPDRATGARVAKKSAPEINNSGTTITVSDLSGIWYDPLRMALEEDLRRETESTERHDIADGLRDISKLENPLTLTGIAEGGVGPAPVSINYQDPETNRRHTVTFQVTGNGTHFSVTSTVPGTEETIKRVKRDRTTRKVVSSKPFLPDFVGKETPLGVLEQDPLWREVVRPLNREFERDWQLAHEAGQRNAVPVTAENLNGLTAVEGADGVYAVRATIRKNVADRGQKPEYRYNPVGYIVERKGSKVQIVWAVPGTSVAFANELRGELEIGELPWRARLILGNVFWTIRKTDGPEHLRLTKRQSEDETEAKE